MNFRTAFARGLRRIAAHFEAAESGMARSSFFAPVQSPVRDAAPATRKKLIAKSRDLYNNHAIFCAIIERLVSYTVGTGFTVSPNTSDERFNMAAARVWKRFADMPELSSRRNFLSLQTILARSIFVDGDIFSVHTYDAQNNPKWQLFEGYRITDKVNCAWDKPDGVVLDSLGRPVSYSLALDDDMMRFVSLPENAVVRYSFDKRANQYRGLPIMHAAITTLLDVKEIVGYEKQSVKYSSSYIGSVSRESGEEYTEGMTPIERIGQLKNGAASALQKESEDAVLEWYERQHSSTLLVGKPGDKISINSTDRPGPAWQGFMTYLVESACLATGLTPSVILGTKMGGADTRAVLATAERVIIPWQDTLCDTFQLEYEWVIENAILRGELTNPPEDWHAAAWHRPAKPTVDAGRIGNLEREDVKAGLMSREQFFSARGMDYRRELRQQAAEAKYILELSKEYGVPPASIDVNFKDAQQNAQPDAQPFAQPDAQAASVVSARCKPGHCDHTWAKNGNSAPSDSAKPQPKNKGGNKAPDNGNSAPSDSAKPQPKENFASVKRKEKGVQAMKSVLKRKVERAEMLTAAGRKVILEKGNEKYGVVHFEQRRYNSGDAKNDVEFERTIDGVAKAMATAEPYEKLNRGIIRYNFDYNGYRAICDERNGNLVFISGYKIYKKSRR